MTGEQAVTVFDGALPLSYQELLPERESNPRPRRLRRSTRYLHHRSKWMLRRTQDSYAKVANRGTDVDGLLLYPLSYRESLTGRESNPRPKYPSSTPPVNLDVAAPQYCGARKHGRGTSDGGTLGALPLDHPRSREAGFEPASPRGSTMYPLPTPPATVEPATCTTPIPRRGICEKSSELLLNGALCFRTTPPPR
jgi:hypothetical protein